MMSRRTRLVSTSALAVCLALGGAGAALAADPPPKVDNNVVGEVVVTAQFREQKLQQTPLAITAVNAQKLEQRGQTDISQVGAQAPNVSLRPSGQGSPASITAFIRGVGQTYLSFAEEPGVGIYVDDVYFSTMTGSLFDLLDLDRVEILRGPQGTLAGKNSEGGAIKLYSKRPDGANGGYVEAGYGSLNQLNARASADFTLEPDKLFVRIAGVTKHHDGYVTRLDYNCTHPGSAIPSHVNGAGCELGTEGSQSFSGLRAAVRWIASPTIEVNIAGDYTYDNSDAQPNVLLTAHNVTPGINVNGVSYGCAFVAYGPNSCDTAHLNDPYVNYSTYDDPAAPSTGAPYKPWSIPSISRTRSWGVSGIIDWNPAPNVSLKSITGYRRYSVAFSDDDDASPIPIQLLYQRQRHRQLSEEVRLNARLLDRVDLTIGGFYFDQYGDETARVDLGYVPFDFLNGYDTTPANTKAGFAHAAWDVTDQLTISGGVRYTTESKTFTFARHNSDGTPILTGAQCFATPSACGNLNFLLHDLDGSGGSYTANRWDYRGNISYKFSPDLMVYGQISTGYKGGGVNPTPFFLSQIVPIAPETLLTYEAGFKSSFLEHRVVLNAAAFYNKFSNIILTATQCDDISPFPFAPCFAPRNIGNANVKGFELETEMHPVAGLELDGSLSYLDFKYTNTNFASTGIPITAKAPYSPKWKWSIGAQYRFEMQDRGSITPRIDATYQSSVFSDANNSPAGIDPAKVVTPPTANTNLISGYALLNGRVTWRNPAGDLQVSMEVTNLTNKLYYLTQFFSPFAVGNVGGQPGMPREWLMTVKKSF